MKTYIAKKVNSKMTVNDERWQKADVAELDCVWENTFPSPYKTTAQLVHSDEGIFLRMATDEWPIRVTAMKHNESVCVDSCMEFFFVPNTEETKYINLEANPAGILRISIGDGRGARQNLDRVHVETLIRPEQGWQLMAYIPYEFLEKHYGNINKKQIRANFYKCGDLTVKKHYSMWNRVETERPDYHRPEYFGLVILSDETI
jgi:hypothetical protein